MAVELKSHQVDIFNGSDPICAGTLISSYLVLTVFNCLKGKNKMGLKVQTSQKDAAETFQTKNVETIHSFPALKSEPSENDIAVILLESDFQLRESLKVIEIIQRDSNEPDGLIALASSGLSSSSCGSFQVERTDHSDCNRTTDNPNSSCFKPSNKSSCPFPLIGSGLICQVHGLHFLCGALAGNGKNSMEYTDISKYLHWIRLTFQTHLSGNGDSGQEHELVGAMFGGREVSASGVSSSIPYQLSLQREKNGNWEHICGAVIIDETRNGKFTPSDFQVVAGVTHLNSTSSLKQILQLQRIIRHPAFKPRNLFLGNDIALLHVNGSFAFNENVQNIWISPPKGSNSTDFTGRVSGWGQISGIAKVSNSLQEADMRILPDSECKQTWKFLKPSMICSFDNESNVCHGDSGGPLVIQNYQFNQKTTRDLLVGIASFSHRDCEQRDEANGFTEVSHFYNWIRENRASRCGATKFQCLNGGCIHECSLCNGADDCGDGSTEKQCEQEMNVTKLKDCARKNQQELKEIEGNLERTEEQLRNKTQVEEMLLDFENFLAPNETEANLKSRASRLQILLEKYENETRGAVEFIQRMNNTLDKLENTEEELQNLKNSSSVQAEKIRELEQEKEGLKMKEEQLKNETVSQNQTIISLKEEASRTLIQLEEQEKDLKTQVRRIEQLEGKLKRTEEQLRNKTQAEEMLLDFLNLLAPNQTENNEIIRRDSGLQVLLKKYDNGTGGAMEFIQRMNSTLIRIEETEEKSENKTWRIQKLEQEKDGLEKKNGQCRNTISSQNQTIISLNEEVGRIRVSLGQKEKDSRDKTRSIQELRQRGRNLEREKEQLENRVSSQSQTINGLQEEKQNTLMTLRRTEEDVENKAQRIQFLEEKEGRLEKSVKELQNLNISQRESLDWMTAEIENLNETLLWKLARCPVDTHLNGFPTTHDSSLAFSSDLYKAAKESQPQNFVLSPLSVRNALAMLSLGATGETAEEIQKVLQLPANASDLINRQSNLISSLKSISSSSLGLRFATGDAVFTNARIRVKQQFKDHVARLGGEIDRVHFSNGTAAARKINTWVRGKTVGKIDKIVKPADLNDQISLLVLNTIYFKGAWKNGFNVSETTQSPFFINGSCSMNVDMMTQKNKFQFADLEEPEAQVIFLPYKGERLSMMIYLPNENGESSISTLENWLKDKSPFDIQTEYLGKPKTVKVSLPKFKIRSSLQLNEPLKTLGLGKMFDAVAGNFSGIFNDSRNFFVSKVSQETFIEVNEEGDEPQAVTGFQLKATSFSATPEFTANRPFLFQIVDRKTKTVLFSGRVKNPLDLTNSSESDSEEGSPQCIGRKSEFEGRILPTVLPGGSQTPTTERSTTRPTTLTTTEKVNTQKVEQSRPVGAPAAVALVYACVDYFSCQTTKHWQKYDATWHGNCKTFENLIESVQLMGPCVTLYERGNCSGKQFQSNWENSQYSWDVQKQFSYHAYGKTYYHGPRSIGPC